MLKRTPFYDYHLSAKAKMVDFAGWEMPLLYRGIVDEHEQTRRSGSLFDVSHMGRLHFGGRDAVPFLDKVLTRNVATQKVGQSRYSLVCNDAGGVLDDVILSKADKGYVLVCNASNREKLLGHFAAVRQDRAVRRPRANRPDRVDRHGRHPGAEGDRPAGRDPAGSTCGR